MIQDFLNQAFWSQASHLLEEIVPVFVFAILASAILDEFLPDEYLDAFFTEDNRFFPVFNAAFIGALVPICTCGMIPLAYKLFKKGLNWKIITAFLVAGNACSIPALWLTTVISYKVVVIRLLASVLFGILVAYGLNLFVRNDFKPVVEDSHDHGEQGHCCGHQDDKAKFQARLKKIADDTLTMAKDFGPWIFVAVAIAAYLNTMVISNAAYDHTSSLAVSFLGSLANESLSLNLSPIFASIVAFPFYFCAGSDIPISKELIELGLPIGTILSFMLASPGVNLTSLLVYRKAIGLKAAFVLTGVSVLMAVLIGIFVNSLDFMVLA